MGASCLIWQMNRYHFEVFRNQAQSSFKCGILITCHFSFCGKFSTKLVDVTVNNNRKTIKLYFLLITRRLQSYGIILLFAAWYACTVARLPIWARGSHAWAPSFSQSHTEDEHLRDRATLWSIVPLGAFSFRDAR